MIFNFECTEHGCPKNDILSGLTVALALVPEAVAFAFVAGVEPLVGLYAAFMVGLITAIIGGRPGMISGATGALAVVMVALVAQHGVEYLFAAVVLMGLIQIGVGILRLGKFIRIVPHPVMLGFVNGLAIVIFLAQLESFQVKDAAGVSSWLEGEMLWLMLGLVALTMAIIQYLPKLTKAVPSSLAAIIVVSLIVIGFGLESRTVGDMASIAGGLPEFHIPMVPFTLETLWIILPYSVIFAAIGLIESLLTLTLIDELTETRGRGNKECVGQGAANLATGFFGGMGGCAMIGQSMININSGGRGRLSGITAAISLLIFILFASGLIEMIPLAALVGVMFMVVIGTFEWSSFRIMGKIPRADAFIIILVSGVTVATDLAIAVVVGVIVSALVFAWEHAKHIRAEITEGAMGSKIYDLHGPLFFASVKNFQDLFDPKNDPDDVVVEFKNSKVMDHSAIEAIDTLAERYMNAEKRLHLRHLSAECQMLLSKAGDLVEVNVIEDPKYHVADDRLA
ncbi:sodium-independent anion transporter [Solemya pervernicosa gill symbiont]|uniref:Sodium-independent anion transporter n=2 Tax=Gammaproteobacteria incertae sedis TaxID=118884 RepID=A0A1T2L1U3_9GAMM|nr:SulP family inorganic anion transporter [Candidatus Reidiella endopervernicosa]OOZ38990.1 sodium-independent anion transporter [Solemya pervernicosa gill symbiont]QKQ25476.1 SulP family inorganic anion transporter [Candidatus Reidiella endopervernicosa]